MDPDRLEADRLTRVVENLVLAIRPFLAGHPPQVQGAVLADLTSLWLSGHYLLGDAAIEKVLRMHIDHVRQLVPIAIESLKARTPPGDVAH